MTEKENFISWMTNKWAQGSINAYSGKIDKLSKDLKSKSMLTVDTLYQIKNPKELETIIKTGTQFQSLDRMTRPPRNKHQMPLKDILNFDFMSKN